MKLKAEESTAKTKVNCTVFLVCVLLSMASTAMHTPYLFTAAQINQLALGGSEDRAEENVR